MDYVELNNLFCDGEDAFLDHKDYRLALDCFSEVLIKALDRRKDPDMAALAIDAYEYIGTLYSCEDEFVWEESSRLINMYQPILNELKRGIFLQYNTVTNL